MSATALLTGLKSIGHLCHIGGVYGTLPIFYFILKSPGFKLARLPRSESVELWAVLQGGRGGHMKEHQPGLGEYTYICTSALGCVFVRVCNEVFVSLPHVALCQES